MLFFKVSYKTIQFLFPAQWSFTESFQVLTPTPLYTISGQLGITATLSLHRVPNLPFLHVLNLLCCSSRSVINLFNSSSKPRDLLLRPFRSSLLPLSTLSWASLARQSYSLTPPPTQSPNPQCSQLTMLFFKVSYITIQVLFPAQWYFTESFQVLTPTPLYTVSGQLGKTATLSPHPLPNLPILHVLNLLWHHSTLSLASLARQSYSLTPPPIQSPNPQCSQLTMLFFKVSYKTIQYLFPAQWFLLRASRSSLLTSSTLSMANLARQSYSLTPPSTQPTNPQCSQLTMLFFKISYKTIQFLFLAQWSFTESFQIFTPITFHTVLGQLVKTELLSHPTPTQSPNPPCSQLTMLFFKVSYKNIQFLFPAQWSFTESFQILTLPLSTLSLVSLARQLLSHPTPYPISQSSMFSTYYVVLQGQLEK